MILRLLCIWLVFFFFFSSLILSNLKHELLNRLWSTMAANVLNFVTSVPKCYGEKDLAKILGVAFATSLYESPKSMNPIQKSCSSEPLRKVFWVATQ
jgi:hypothetical protein